MFGATTGIGGIIIPIGMAVGVAAKPFVEIGADYGFGLLEEFVLNGILEGKNPKIFIDKFKEELKKTSHNSQYNGFGQLTLPAPRSIQAAGG